MPHGSNEFRNNTLPSPPPQPHSTFISFSLRLCTGWIDFTLFGFDNHVYCAMKCGVAEGWQYPSTQGNLLTAGARWRYSLAQERSAHSDTTASVCTTGSLAVIYDASRAITLSLTLIQQFIYCQACIRAEVSFLQRGGGGRGGGGNCLQSARVTSIVSQETSHVTWFSGGKPDEASCFFAPLLAWQQSVTAPSAGISWDEGVWQHLHPSQGRQVQWAGICEEQSNKGIKQGCRSGKHPPRARHPHVQSSMLVSEMH